MFSDQNHLGQPVGMVVPDWKTPPKPIPEVMNGRFCKLEPLEPSVHAASLFAANALDKEGKNWTYLAYGPFDILPSYQSWLEQWKADGDVIPYAIVDANSGKAVGVAVIGASIPRMD